MSKKNLIFSYLLLCLLIGCGSSEDTIISNEIDLPPPQTENNWDNDPCYEYSIYICSKTSSEVEKLTLFTFYAFPSSIEEETIKFQNALEEAIIEWNNSFGFDLLKQVYSEEEAEVIITIKDIHETLSHYKGYTYNAQETTGVDSFFVNKKLLSHKIGHDLGLGHDEEAINLMHDYLNFKPINITEDYINALNTLYNFL